jgi:D-alanyl-D-alanine carboxypeptidase/D-alanyl-D-alanine-endopeptidase (penicillin-binding protein 4)
MKYRHPYFLYHIIIAGILISPVHAFGQTKSALENEIELLQNDKDLKQASWSVFAMETSSGNVLADYNSEIVLEPASVLKVVTTGAALSILGPDFRFETMLEYSGTIEKNGTLRGNIYITGGGDPTIGSDRFGMEYSTDSLFAEFAASLKKNNIKHISGKIIADASVFTDNPMAYSWGWEDIGNYYASGAWGINVNENLYRLYFDAGKNIGDKAELVKMEAEAGGIDFINHVITGNAGSGDNVVIFGSPYNDQRLLEGSVPLGKMDFDVDGSIPDPPLYLVRLLTKYLNNMGIEADSVSTTLRAIQWQGKTDTNVRITIDTHKSPPLSVIIIPTHVKSVNLFAEAILKTIGRIKKNEGSESSGTEAITEYWSKKGIDLTGFDMQDGCGLSRKNKISTRQLVSMLQMIKNEKYFPTFEMSLPLAGVSGGMASMLKGSIAEKNLRAKTGNMEKIKSYVGYVKNAGGKDLAYTIIVNNYSCTNAVLKQKLEKLMLLIAQTK